jgi:hypothetical protein
MTRAGHVRPGYSDPMASSAVAAVASRIRTIFRHLVAVAACALTAHVAAYTAVLPEDAVHGYFAWYASAVALLSIAAVAGTVVALVTAFVSGPSGRASSVVRAMLPPASREDSLVARVLTLAFGGIAFLAAQETLERSLPGGRLVLVGFAPFSLAVIAGVVILLAGAIALVERAVARISTALLRDVGPRRERTDGRPPCSPGAVRLRASRPLTIHGGLRAPPALA